MTGSPHPAVVLFVADLRRMTRFYREVAGCSVVSSAADHVILDAAGLELLLHRIPAEFSPELPDGEPHVAEDAAFNLCLPVPALRRARELARGLGGGLRDPEAEWDGDGYRACDGWDPEGNVVQFRESGEPATGAA